MKNHKIQVPRPPDNDRASKLTRQQYFNYRQECRKSFTEINLSHIKDDVVFDLMGGEDTVFYTNSKNRTEFNHAWFICWSSVVTMITGKENFNVEHNFNTYVKSKSVKFVYRGKRGELADIRPRENILEIKDFFFPQNKVFLDRFILQAGCHKDKVLSEPGVKPYIFAKVRLIQRKRDKICFETHQKCIVDTKKQTIHKTKNGAKTKRIRFENEKEFWENLTANNISS